MTETELDNYLESIGGLLNGYKPDQRLLKSAFFEFDEGWYGITKTLIEDLIALGWDKQLCQAKEKFGTGRFYVNGATDPVYARIQQWQDETAITCESCGTTENVDLRGKSWIKTLCEACYDQQNKK